MDAGELGNFQQSSGKSTDYLNVDPGCNILGGSCSMERSGAAAGTGEDFSGSLCM